MKFSGSGRMALYGLKEYLKKNSAKKKSDKNKTNTKKRTAENTKPITKKRIIERIKKPKSDIDRKIEKHLDLEEGRNFPLDEGIMYHPNYILKQTRNGKKIIIHVDTGMVGKNILAYKSFMKMFKNAYHVIMVVSYGQLRAWNEQDCDRHILFDEVWTVDDIDYMIKSIKNTQDIDMKSNMAVCHICNKKADNLNKIKAYFVYSTEEDGSLKVQPYCRECDKARLFGSIAHKESHVKCIGCGTMFRTIVATEVYCDSCNSKFTS